METLTKVASVLGVVGVPSIFAIVLWCAKKCRILAERNIVLQRAQKAQMRSQLLDQYCKYEEQGWIDQEHLDDWMNQYNEYHKLVGENEVLDDRKARLIGLPHRPETKKTRTKKPKKTEE